MGKATRNANKLADKVAWLTYLSGFWCDLFLAALAAWPPYPLKEWLGHNLVGAVHAVFLRKILFDTGESWSCRRLVELGLR